MDLNRLKNEKQALDERIMDLFEFMSSEVFDKLNFENRHLIAQQREAMLKYSNILNERILIFGGGIYGP